MLLQRRESVGAIIWRFVYPLLMFVGVDFVIEMIAAIGYMGYRVTTGGVDLDAQSMETLTNDLTGFIYDKALYLTILRSAILIPLYYLFMRGDKKRDKMYGRYVEYTPLNKKWLLILPIVGFTAAIGFNRVVPLLIQVLQTFAQTFVRVITGKNITVDFFASFNELSDVVYSGSIWIQLLASSVAAPLVEEFLFRGLLYKRIRTYMKMVPSMLISAFVFGVIHGNMVQFAYAFFIGLFLAYVYEKYKTIWAPVIFHAGANMISVIITSLLNDINLGMDIGSYMLLTVVELAVTFLLMKLIDVKVNRCEISSDDGRPGGNDNV